MQTWHFSPTPFARLVALVLCCALLAPSAIVERTRAHSSAAPSPPVPSGPSIPGPNLPDLDQARGLSSTVPLGDESPDVCSECPDPTPTPTPVVNQPPTAIISNTPYSGMTNTPVQFYEASVDVDGWIANRLWVFGDGATSTEITPTHTYATANTYTVSLTVTDNKGATNIATTAVNIAAPTPGAGNNAVCDTQTVVTSMTAGQTYAVMVKMRNTGTTAWTRSGSFRLGAQYPQDNLTWMSTNRVDLPTEVEVAPNTTFNFSFNVIAPATPGTYDFQWKMVQDGVAWFGTASPNLRINVTLPPAPRQKTVFDFDGDTKSDPTVWHPVSGDWDIIKSSTNTHTIRPDWGRTSLGDIAVPADYDGDNKTDLAVWRPSEGNWYVVKSSTGAPLVQYWGQNGDQPVPGDYDGDGKADYAVFRPSEANWYIRRSSDSTQMRISWGDSTDVPVPGDYDGDGKTDIAVFRPAEGNWYIRQSSNSAVKRQGWGAIGDVVVPGDYDGDGRTDIAVYRPNGGTWYIIDSQTGVPRVQGWGDATDKPVPADYDGDGKTDVAVWRPSEGNWYILRSHDGMVISYLGTSTDIPASSTYNHKIGDEALFVSQSVSSTMVAGYAYSVSVTLRNTGSTTWPASGSYKLGPQNPANNNNWNAGDRILLPVDVLPGSNVTVDFQVIAPATPGTTNFQWQMIRDVSGGGWFGDLTPNVAVSISTSGGSGGPYTPTNILNARIDPRNRTGQDGVDLLSRNFNWSLPILGLPGRADFDLDLSLSYNSLVWTRYNSTIRFDADQGYPAPGFRLGFPVLQGPFNNDEAHQNAFLLITPAGGRVELRQVGTSALYEAVDSSYLQLDSSSMTLRTTNGVQLRFQGTGTQYVCYETKDSNGNYLSVTYDTTGRLLTITDTLARVVVFEYYTDGSNRLRSIKQTWKGGVTHVWAQFFYGPQYVASNFANLNVQGPSNQNITVLRQVTLADQSSYRFDYTSYGQINTIRHYAADNHQLSYTTYSLQTSDNDCPRVTQQQSWVENWNDSAPVSTLYESDLSTYGQVTTPDGTLSKEFYGTGWQRGLTTQTEIWSGGTRQKWTEMLWEQDNQALTYPLNPRLRETDIHDASNNHRRTTTSYTSYGLPSDTYEYKTDGSTVLRRNHVEYNLDAAYVNRRIIGLVKEQRTYSLNPTTSAEELLAKVTYNYDQGEEYLKEDEGAPVQHDGYYGLGFVQGRGLLTSTRRWNVKNGNENNVAETVQIQVGYNTAGVPLFTRDAAGHTSRLSYLDAFDDSATVTHPLTLAYPTTVTDADDKSSTMKYDYYIGAMTYSRDPKGAEQTATYDGAGRVLQITNLVNNAHTRWTYPDSQLIVNQFTNIESTASEAYSATVFDGAGRVRATASLMPHNDNSYSYSGQYTAYDIMGRIVRQSNPTEMNGTWQAIGDDNQVGWLFTTQSYDWKGRPLVTTNVDSTTRVADYTGCGCAGGEMVTLTNEVGRRQKSYHDVLGRLIKTEIFNEQAVYTTIVNSYNGLDQVTSSKQYEGSGNSNVFQETTQEYDGHARLWKRHTPLQDAGRVTSYEYYPDDMVKSVTDARGVRADFTYNGRHLLTSVAYDRSGVLSGQNVAETSRVDFDYDAAGNRSSIISRLNNVTQSSVTYNFNTLSLISSETRTFAGLPGSYTLSYDYNPAGELRQLTDPFGGVINYGFDSAGRLSNVTGTGFGSVSQFATNMQYRAWGALKSETYGNGYTAKAEYNARLQVQSFELRDSGNQVRMSSEHQYYSDGQLKAAHNLLDERFDRAYKYDSYGRLAEAYTGSEARDFLSGTQSGAATGPYRQSYGYDAFNRLNYRDSRFWNHTDSTINLYSGARRSDLQYDADGNVTLEGDVTYGYDAAGRVVSLTDNSNNSSTSISFDGDGRSTRNVNLRTRAGGPQTRTLYYLRSSVLGGLTVVELDTNGQKVRGYVYAGSRKLALTGLGAVSWEHADPMTDSRVISYSNGTSPSRMEFEPLGASVGLYNPFLAPEPEPYPDFVGAMLGECSNASPNCVRCSADGLSANCADVWQLLGSGAALQCPDNNCGPKVTNGQISFLGINPNTGELAYGHRLRIDIVFKDELGNIIDRQKGKVHYLQDEAVATDNFFGHGGSQQISDSFTRAVDKAFDRVTKIFENKPDSPCAKFFGPNALTVLQGMRETPATIKPKTDSPGATATGIRQSYDYQSRQGKYGEYRLPAEFLAFQNGPFFAGGKGNIGGYSAGTYGAQNLAILHELAHNIIKDGKYLISNDGNDATLSADNTSEILKHCSEEAFDAK